MRVWSRKWDAWWPCKYARDVIEVWAVGYRESVDAVWKSLDAFAVQADARYVELSWSPGCRHAGAADEPMVAHAGSAAALPLAIVLAHQLDSL